jgi:hypothetical protein
MGNLVKETPYSEVTATLEKLSKYGIGREELRRLRTSSSALMKQIACILEREDWLDSIGDYALSAFQCFSVNFTSSEENESFRNEVSSRIIDNSEIKELIRGSNGFGSERRGFIIIDLDDFNAQILNETGTFLFSKEIKSASWLKRWSLANLLGGYYLAPCVRSDTAIHIALAFDYMNNVPKESMVIYENENQVGIAKCSDEGNSWFVSRQRILYTHAIFELKRN